MQVSKVTSKFQATVPSDVRAALGIKAGDTIAWDVEGGVARVRKALPVDWTFLAGVEAGLAQEWLSEDDQAAFRDL